VSDKILCVDDEANILEGFKRQLRKQFAIDTALSGEAGLALLHRAGPFAVVVSDMRMPGMNGAQFLAKARECAPDSVRLMLTGQADMHDTIAAVNEGNIFRFLTKPCPPEVLVKALEAALAQYRLITAERTLLEQTLHGSIKMLTDVLALVNPVAFGQASRLKQYVHHIAIHLNLSDVWQFELAAMLSPLGCVTLPAEILEKVYAGQLLSSAEQRLFAAHPTVGHDLLCHIPRLETVAAMIARQHEPLANGTTQAEPQQRDTVILGAQLLTIALDFDRLWKLM
jgi:response regulator RpfG family c-di-GMP phosphodiesterase